MKVVKSIVPFLLAVFFSVPISAQCDNWIGLSNEDALTDSFVIFRDYLKQKKFDKAFPLWEEVYRNAPAADGRRDHVYSAGVELYFYKFQNTKSKKRKSEYAQMVRKLIEEQRKCYPENKVLILSLIHI